MSSTHNMFSDMLSARNPFPPALDFSRPAGIGFRHAHYEPATEQKQDIGWIEVHPENYFGGGKPRHYLSKAAALYPLSLHAVGMSLGSHERVHRGHLSQIKALIDEFNPFVVSDHVSWSMSGNAHLNDLMPLPYTEETLKTVSRNIDEVQNFFGRQILVENPSTYIAFAADELREWEVMNELARRTSCGILLDVNNIYVQAHNHGNDPYDYIANINPRYVGEMHLAGHTEKSYEDCAEKGGEAPTMLIDTHSKQVRDEVWNLYDFAVRRIGPVPTLIEWDADLPALEVLVGEAHKARDIIHAHYPCLAGTQDRNQNRSQGRNHSQSQNQGQEAPLAHAAE